MASDKRTVLSTKRASVRRQRATRRADKKNQVAATTTTTSTAVAAISDAHTPTALSAATLEPLARKTQECVEPVSSGDDGTLNSSSGEDGGLSDDDDDNDVNVNNNNKNDDDDDASDGELVIVRYAAAAAPAFCTQFVAPDQLSSVAPTRTGSKRCREFAATVPRFRDTSDGFTAYTIAITTNSGACYELERRFSEFVALATALQRDSAPSASSGSNNNSDGGAVHWELPPKTWFRVTQRAALEERRRQLDQSLARLLAMDAGTMSRRAVVRDFLQLDIFGAQVAADADDTGAS